MASPKKLELTAEHREELEKMVKSGVTPVDLHNRARILLLKAEGLSADEVAEKVGTTSRSVSTWTGRYSRRGPHDSLISLLSDAPGRGRKPTITDVELKIIVEVACIKPVYLDRPEEKWSMRGLTKFLNKLARETGEERLSTISHSTIARILKKNDIKPWKVRYYCEERDPDFRSKRDNILLVYKMVNIIRNGTPEELEELRGAHPWLRRNVHFVSLDEKPGIQCTRPTVPDLPPRPISQEAADGKPTDQEPEPGEDSAGSSQPSGIKGMGEALDRALRSRRYLAQTFARDYEYVRMGTVDLLASIDLLTGHVHYRVSDSHKSEDYIKLLERMDAYYPKGDLIVVTLDNLRVHMSAKVKEYLAGNPDRFLFVFTPKHASWLNMIEIFFSKVSRCLLHHIAVEAPDELKRRISQYIDEINLDPVVFCWKWGLEDIDITTPLKAVTLVNDAA